MSESTHEVRVDLGERSYSIDIGTGILARLGEQVGRLGRVSHAVLITDGHVEKPHAAAACASLSAADIEVDMLVVPPGEPTKSVDVAYSLWEQMLEVSTDRRSLVVAVGGGVVGDLAGFAAATFARGLRYWQVPTTLLAQVDSSVGGKTGVNLPGAKNMVGAFWQPSGVLIDTAVLETLPDREYRSGLAEVVKYGVILDADFFAYLEKHAAGLIERHPEVLVHVIARSCQLKAQVVRDDERELTGLRSVLNFGHTYGHAIEALSGYDRWLHGEAVSIGMLCAARLAERLKRVDGNFTRRLRELLIALGLPVTLLDVDVEEMLEVMAHDKKAEHGKLKFVLPTRLGHVELVGDVSADDVRQALVA